MQNAPQPLPRLGKGVSPSHRCEPRQGFRLVAHGCRRIPWVLGQARQQSKVACDPRGAVDTLFGAYRNWLG